MDRAFLTELRRIVGDSNVLEDALELLTYECDALPHLRETPAAVALPSSAAHVQAIIRLCAREGVPFVARGHGTGLSGGALPVAGGLVTALARLNRILDVDIPNQRVTVEPGVTNLDITKQVAPFGYYYAPDPSSQQVCSIGGNVAENSGGAHCLKYGFTVHHVLALEAVLPDGELVHLGSSMPDAPGPDLVGQRLRDAGVGRVRRRGAVDELRHQRRRQNHGQPEHESHRLARFLQADLLHLKIPPTGELRTAVRAIPGPRCPASVRRFDSECAPGPKRVGRQNAVLARRLARGYNGVATPASHRCPPTTLGAALPPALSRVS
jgi:hypothetical protein